ncbi:hypothetical protein [uncultured Ruegeria sp.]|uniref:hypothetical protein n=1 Tax=uncultured Ruegeria sp. TaxID=259304 RepID=UPI0026088027|nr:hypothetical protein [uncultured Ruegeria sp.]
MMAESNKRFTMSLRQAKECGIDFRDFERVDQLPSEIPLVAVAGVWGKFQNILCLFEAELGRRYLRNVYQRRNGYVIPELGICAKTISAGETVTVTTSPPLDLKDNQ